MLEDFKKIASSTKDLRRFGLAVGGVLLFIGAILFFKQRISYGWFLAAGAFFFFGGALAPRMLLPFQKLWMAFGIIIGFFATRIILLITYSILLVPISLAARMFGENFLERSEDKNAASYWHPKKEITKENYEHQY